MHHPRPPLYQLSTLAAIVAILDEVLGLDGRSSDFDSDTRLLGAVPELDSMAVVAIVTTLEEQFGFFVDDDGLDGADFETVGTLVALVERYGD